MRYLLLGVTILVAAVTSSAYVFLKTNWSNLAIQATDNATDTNFALYVKIVDERGIAVQNVNCEYRILGFNHSWAVTGGSSQRGVDVFGHASTDSDGMICIRGVGHSVLVTDFKCDGYSRLYDEQSNDAPPAISAGRVAGFVLRSHGQTIYEPDPNRPAVFVMIRDGSKIATTLPSMGGSYPPVRVGSRRLPLVPIWPEKASIPGVTYVPAR